MKTCKKCEQLFTPSKGLSNYCSLKCRNSRVHTEQTKDKIRDSLRGSVLTDKHKLNISKSWNSDRKNSQIIVASNRFKNKIASTETREKISIANKGKKLSNGTIEKLRLQAVNRFSQFPEQHPNRRCAGIKESYPEKVLRLYFELSKLEANVHFIQQYRVGKYFVDYYIPSLNLVLEVDGERWHSDKVKEQERNVCIGEFHNIIHFSAAPLIKKEYQGIIDVIILDIKNGHKHLW